MYSLTYRQHCYDFQKHFAARYMRNLPELGEIDLCIDPILPYSGEICHVMKEAQLDTQDVRIKGSYIHVQFVSTAEYRMHWFPGEITMLFKVRLLRFGNMILHMGVHHIKEKRLWFGLIFVFEWILLRFQRLSTLRLRFTLEDICFVNTYLGIRRSFNTGLSSLSSTNWIIWFFGSYGSPKKGE